MLTVIAVKPGTELLLKVRDLWRRHSDTLGFFPEGAFDDYAGKDCILAAIEHERNLLGYTIFRITNGQKASIAHLCIEPQERGRGVASVLFDAVKSRVSSCDDIIVRCRRDFSASTLWPRLGFVPVGEEKGRGKIPQIVTIWRYELNRLPLLAALDRGRIEVMPVAIDANVFFDLDEHPGTVSHDESKALVADWLGAFIELCVTEEIYNEIDRRDDPEHRARQRARVEHFRVLPSDKARERQIFAELEQLFPTWNSDSGRSDRRQLARAIAGGTAIFVTRDTLIRAQAEELHERFGLVVVSPFELILKFDELRREDAYRPQRFVSIGLKKDKPRGSDTLEKVADLVHLGQPSSEPRRRTLARLRDIAASPERFEFECFSDSDGALLAAYAVERPTADVLRIPILCVANSPIGRTASHHFVEKLTMLAAAERRAVVLVKEEAGGRRLEDALICAGFSRDREYWIKLALSVVGPIPDVIHEIDRLGAHHAAVKSLTDRVTAHLRPGHLLHSSPTSLAYLERTLWPAKITGTNLLCYIVPIRPHWAEQLFDVNLANRTLFGADPMLAMNFENAYYRAARPAVLTAPARILWYVSQDAAYPGTMAIRACSYLDEIMIAPPKEAFRRFQRLGIYKWTDVFQVANNDLRKEIMAFRFSRTELLRNPIGWHRLQEELRRNEGKRSQFQSPIQVTEQSFMELYKLGMNGA